MRTSLFSSLFGIALALGALVNAQDVSGAGCSVTATLTARSASQMGSYASGSGIDQIYDITVANSGSCTADAFLLDITAAPGGSISSTFNLQASGAHYAISSNGGGLAVGNSANAGFIVNYPNTVTAPSGATTTVFSISCPAACVSAQSTAASSTAASTTASSTTASSTTASSTTASSTTATTSSVAVVNGNALSCQQISSSLAFQGNWTDGTYEYDQYTINIRNTLSYPVNNITLIIYFEGGDISQQWNLTPASATYSNWFNEDLYNLAPGATYSGAGFIWRGSLAQIAALEAGHDNVQYFYPFSTFVEGCNGVLDE